MRSWSCVAWMAVAALLVPLAAEAQGTGVQYQLFINCPQAATFQGNLGPSCPVRAIDPSQEQILGEPTLAVDPFDASKLIIANLHGAVKNDGDPAFTCDSSRPGPTARSRCGLPFTTFTSSDSGATWTDNFFQAPRKIADAYGEHPGITIDPYGHVYVGSLYASPLGNGRFDYTLVAQKFNDLDAINQHQNGEYQAQFLKPFYAGNRIGQVWFLFNPQTDNMTMLWNEQVTAASGTFNSTTPADSCSADGSPSAPPVTSPSSGSNSSTNSSTSSNPGASSSSSSTAPLAAGQGRQSLGLATPPLDLSTQVRADSAPAPSLSTATAAPRSIIGVLWTTPDVDACYHYQRSDWSIGPCEGSTNPVLSEGWLYVGCVARTDEGPFPWHPDTHEGLVEMFRMRPNGGQPQYLGASDIEGGLPKLGVRSDGRLALATATTHDGALDLRVQFGHYDPGSKRISWTQSRSLGAAIDKGQALLLAGANIQDLTYREHSGVVHLILKERLQPSAGVQTVADPRHAQLRKRIVAIDEGYGVVGQLSLDIGNPANRTNPVLLDVPEDAFDDLSDDFLQYPMVPQYNYTDGGGQEHQLNNYQREFFAVSDYGEVLFAELVEVTNLRGPAFGLPTEIPPPNPSPAASTTNAGAVVPAAGLTLVGALSLALIATKRKQAAVLRQRLGKPGSPWDPKRP